MISKKQKQIIRDYADSFERDGFHFYSDIEKKAWIMAAEISTEDNMRITMPNIRTNGDDIRFEYNFADILETLADFRFNLNTMVKWEDMVRKITNGAKKLQKEYDNNFGRNNKKIPKRNLCLQYFDYDTGTVMLAIRNGEVIYDIATDLLAGKRYNATGHKVQNRPDQKNVEPETPTNPNDSVWYYMPDSIIEESDYIILDEDDE